MMMEDTYKSLESILDEERREILALLEVPSSAPARPNGRASSGRASSPNIIKDQSTVRLVDIDDDIAHWITKHAAIVGTNNEIIPAPNSRLLQNMLNVGNEMSPRSPSTSRKNGAPPASPTLTRSMLDITSKPRSTALTLTKSAAASPTEATHRNVLTKPGHIRSLSDAASRPASFGPRSASGTRETGSESLGYLPSSLGGATLAKRNTPTGKKLSLPSAMAEVVRSGGDLPGLSALLGSRNRERRNSASRERGNEIVVVEPKSTRRRSSLRSSSPSVSPDTIALENGRFSDVQSPHRKLSDGSLTTSKRGQSSLSANSRRRANSGSAIGLNIDRLEKTQEEDVVGDSSEGEDSDRENPRGRRAIGRVDGVEEENEDLTLGTRKKGVRKAKDSLEREEEEVAALDAKYGVHSLLDPQITVTGPAGDRTHKYRAGVHPNTSYDEGGSGINTPVDSDTEAEITDIKRAQKLQLHTTNIVSTANTSRCVRTIYRGDFAKMQQEAGDNQRRVRKYLVATDLSEEAAHALEWTVGTVLRDGDTLLAIYCVDEDVGISTNDNSADDHIKEQAAAVASSAATMKAGSSTPVLGPLHISSPLAQGFATDNLYGMNNARGMSPAGWRNKAEVERVRAVQHITDMVSKLLRKTKLQVKVVIEVIHCKSPKHLITEVIDYINPTLVILGSRGRSALKGVILGSFSNYLVTKSSVPVMVARKRLKKHTKYKRPPMKLTNNLTNPVIRSLVDAKID